MEHEHNHEHEHHFQQQIRLIEKSPGLFSVRGPGPMAWCNRCSRRHPRGNCDLVEETRIAKSGKKVTRLVHPKPRKKAKSAKSKTKARKT